MNAHITEAELDAAIKALDNALSGSASLGSCVHAVLGALANDTGRAQRPTERLMPRPEVLHKVSTKDYVGGLRWAVRWGERRVPPSIHEQSNEEQARSLYRFLLTRYTEMGRTDAPELLSAKLHWEVATDG